MGSSAVLLPIQARWELIFYVLSGFPLTHQCFLSFFYSMQCTWRLFYSSSLNYPFKFLPFRLLQQFNQFKTGQFSCSWPDTLSFFFVHVHLVNSFFFGYANHFCVFLFCYTKGFFNVIFYISIFGDIREKFKKRK